MPGCLPVGAKCDYFNPTCCPGLKCSKIGICSEIAPPVCSGPGQPCANGCCDGLVCTNGICNPQLPPKCPPGNTPCTSCIYQSCCPELNDCQADPACNKTWFCIEQCLQQPNPNQCASNCVSGGLPPAFVPLAQCVGNVCSFACGG